MRQVLLFPAEVPVAYDAVSELYAHVPPLSIWRSWEYAAHMVTWITAVLTVPESPAGNHASGCTYLR